MEMRHLKVVSYNIHKGFGRNSRKFNLRKIREALMQVGPDLVFLQEVLGHHEIHRKKIKDWPQQPQFEYLAHELWPHFAYGKNAVYTHGHHGNAILSKYPFEFFENIDISTHRLAKRGLLHGMIEIPGKRKILHTLCIHLGLFEAERAAQVRQLGSRIESHVPHEDPLIICGDFNDWRLKASAQLRKRLGVKEAFLEVDGAHARTFPAWLPALRLDRIYFRGLNVQNAKVLTSGIWSELSDHAALLADLAYESN